MKFYNREEEVAQLVNSSQKTVHGGIMSIVVGRRRVGKTSLIRESFAYQNSSSFIYLFISKKSEVLLSQEFVDEIKQNLDIPIIGSINNLSQIFKLLLEYSLQNQITLVFDEFQELENINPSIYSVFQNYWDQYKNKSKMHLILCGSIYSLMIKIFENNKEPLFGRANYKINLQPLKVRYIKEILEDNKKYSSESLLNIYTITGGIPRYLELLAQENAWDLDAIINCIFSANSFFLNEGKHLLIEEFGKDYQIYFSILSLIASGKTSRSAIESVLQKGVGGYLDNLDNEYSIIAKIRPVFAKPNSRTIKYVIKDNFLNFWFRYFYRNQSALELENFDYVKEIVKKEFSVYSGSYLEKMYIELFKESKKYNVLGGYWEKENLNEIDIVACNSAKKTLSIVEIKRNAKKINLSELENKAKKLVQSHADYKVDYLGLSLADVDKYL